MKDAFIKLHISIILAGATGIFGKLISLNEALLVWYRMMLASLLFLLVLSVGKRLNRISFGDAPSCRRFYNLQAMLFVL